MTGLFFNVFLNLPEWLVAGGGMWNPDPQTQIIDHRWTAGKGAHPTFLLSPPQKSCDNLNPILQPPVESGWSGKEYKLCSCLGLNSGSTILPTVSS